MKHIRIYFIKENGCIHNWRENQWRLEKAQRPQVGLMPPDGETERERMAEASRLPCVCVWLKAVKLAESRESSPIKGIMSPGVCQ